MVMMTQKGGLFRQIARYAITGIGLTALYSAIYWISVVPGGIAPLVANTLAFVIVLVIGYYVHSRWSFHGHGDRGKPTQGYSRYLIVNLLGYALNSFWVWLFVEYLHQPVAVPLLPIAFVTPWMSFWINRRWVFA